MTRFLVQCQGCGDAVVAEVEWEDGAPTRWRQTEDCCGAEVLSTVRTPADLLDVLEDSREYFADSFQPAIH